MYYEIAKVNGQKEFDTKYGKMIGYNIQVVDNEGMVADVEMNQKLDTPAPIVGQKIHGFIEDSDFGLKFKKTQPEDGQSQGVQKAYSAPRSSNTHEDTRSISIERQAMVKAACELLAGKTEDAEKVLAVADKFVTYVQSGSIGKPASKDVPASDIPF